MTSLFESPTGAQAEIHDMTQSVYWVSGTPGAIKDTMIDIGTYNEASIGLPLANFGKVTYTNTTVNGDYLGFDAPTKFNSFNGADTLVRRARSRRRPPGRRSPPPSRRARSRPSTSTEPQHRRILHGRASSSSAGPPEDRGPAPEPRRVTPSFR